MLARLVASALPPVATVGQASEIGSDVPLSDQVHCSENSVLFDHLVGEHK
jgi:hypothetical protein